MMQQAITTSHAVCKKCYKGVLVNRVKRPVIVKVLSLGLPIKRYKCNHCHKKSYLLDLGFSGNKSKGMQAY